jgi:hypothetical protein
LQKEVLAAVYPLIGVEASPSAPPGSPARILSDMTFWAPTATIAGGTTEVLRSSIAGRLLSGDRI